MKAFPERIRQRLRLRLPVNQQDEILAVVGQGERAAQRLLLGGRSPEHLLELRQSHDFVLRVNLGHDRLSFRPSLI
jgi:hypothetical protein